MAQSGQASLPPACRNPESPLPLPVLAGSSGFLFPPVYFVPGQGAIPAPSPPPLPSSPQLGHELSPSPPPGGGGGGQGHWSHGGTLSLSIGSSGPPLPKICSVS